MSAQGEKISYSEWLRDAAEYCDEFSAHEKLTWEGYRPERYEAPAATAVALRELARLIGEAEAAGADASYAMRYQGLIHRLAAGFLPSSSLSPSPRPGARDVESSD